MGKVLRFFSKARYLSSLGRRSIPILKREKYPVIEGIKLPPSLGRNGIPSPPFPGGDVPSVLRKEKHPRS